MADWKTGSIIGFTLIAIALFAAIVIGSQLIEVRIELDPAGFPTPIPTHTPMPTHTPVGRPTATPTIVPTPATGQDAIRLAISAGQSVQSSDLVTARYHPTDRRLRMPHCPTAIGAAEALRYFWILLPPGSANIRSLTLDGVDQLGAFTHPPPPTTIDGTGYNGYHTAAPVSCGDSVRPGLGGRWITFVLQGDS